MNSLRVLSPNEQLYKYKPIYIYGDSHSLVFGNNHIVINDKYITVQKFKNSVTIKGLNKKIST